jgi:hypothetical protein
MQREGKYYYKIFPIFWHTCHWCDKETRLEVMYVYTTILGTEYFYCKKCHELKKVREDE